MKTATPLLLLLVLGQATTVLPGAKIYLENFRSNVDWYITQEIAKQKVPLVVVKEEQKADFILEGDIEALGNSDIWPIRLPKNRANVRLVSARDRDVIVWAGEADDMGGWTAGGYRGMASRIVKKMKRDLFSAKK